MDKWAAGWIQWPPSKDTLSSKPGVPRANRGPMSFRGELLTEIRTMRSFFHRAKFSVKGLSFMLRLHPFPFFFFILKCFAKHETMIIDQSLGFSLNILEKGKMLFLVRPALAAITFFHIFVKWILRNHCSQTHVYTPLQYSAVILYKVFQNAGRKTF